MVDGLVPVAAPLTTPVDVSNASPAGRVGEIAKVIGAAPPLKVMGVNAFTARSL